MRNYMIVLFRGFNAMTALALEPIIFRREEEIVFAIFVMTAQIIVQAWVLGTLLHYVLKVDPSVEAL